MYFYHMPMGVSFVCFIFVVSKSKIMIINKEVRLLAKLRRLKFLIYKHAGLFWIIKYVGLYIKEPYNKLYQRSIKKKGR